MRPRIRRYAALAVLGIGLSLAVSVVAPELPKDQTLVFRLPERPVRALSATFTPRGEAEPVGGVTLAFEDAAPREVRHQVSLPNGPYELAIHVESPEEPPASGTSVLRRVELEGGVTTIFVEDRRP
jgi:hypothetical protein